MAKYLILQQVGDDTITPEQQHLTHADVHVDALLIRHGINPADVVLPNALLTEIARLTALRLIYIEQQSGPRNPQDQFIFFEKAKKMDELLMPLIASLSRDTLDMANPPSRITCELI